MFLFDLAMKEDTFEHSVCMCKSVFHNKHEISAASAYISELGCFLLITITGGAVKLLKRRRGRNIYIFAEIFHLQIDRREYGP